jgi:Kip1 ubiquitination-promoting complex protein 2
MKIKVKSIIRNITEVEINPFDTIISLKKKLQKQFELDLNEQKIIFKGKILKDESKIQENNLQEGDIIILLKKRKYSKLKEKGEEDNISIPTRELISKYTNRNLNYSSIKISSNSLQNIKNRISNFLTSILQKNNLSENEENEENEENHNEIETNSNLQNQQQINIQIDIQALQNLKDMGFNEERAKKALLLNGMNPQKAMDWLLVHESDEDIDIPLTQSQINALYNSNFIPNPDALKKLQEMGFEEEDIKQALKITNNNQEAACSWLLGDFSSINNDNDTDFLQNLLTSPIMQKAFSNPRILQVLQTLFQHPEEIEQYMQDPEIKSFLIEISNYIQNNS